MLLLSNRNNFYFIIFRKGKSGNLDFITSLSQWVLKEVGVLRAKSVTHHKVGERKSPSEYTIMEDVVNYLIVYSLIKNIFSFMKLIFKNCKMENGVHIKVKMFNWNLFALIHLFELH